MASNDTGNRTTLAALLEQLLGPDLPIGIRAYDGSHLGPPEDEAPATIVIRSPDALRRIVTAPGELGFGRAYVAGDLDVEGDIYEALRLGDILPSFKLTPKQWAAAAKLVGVEGLKPLPPPPEESHLHGRRHSKERDAAAIRHHYDVGNEFYELVLGSTMTYSCAVFEKPSDALDQAQEQKYELICRKLDLQPGQRVLDVGCGWGGMAMHAAMHHGARAVGVTISPSQAAKATERVAAAGLSDRVDIRLLDYRDVVDGPYDAICSIGMFEHVGLVKLGEYFDRLRDVVVPGGRILNHGISRPWKRGGSRFGRSSFIDRYVFPDGELHEVGAVVSAMQQHGLEVRHVESLREHYALTLRHWVANLEEHWDEAVGLVGPGRARVWRLYMAASALNFERGRTQIHQVLAVRPDGGASHMSLRPDWGS
ncbi:MAG TPA: cyclopropane-fatty-acyl-phospholipid synthase family protein [Acidimicrobiales bacterium]|nr:cyclopropane-fatty-acyl-phospholipid synthase family protein [Acidimicrobiales bacterium]